MDEILPYVVTFRHMVEQTGQTTIAANSPKNAAKGAEILLKRFGITGEIIEVKEYQEETISLQ